MSRRSDGEGSIRKRPDGRYEVRISIDKKFNGGQPKRISRYADTEEEAGILRNMGCAVEVFTSRTAKYAILGENRVAALSVNGEEHPCDAVFILRPAAAPDTLLSGLAMDGVHIAVDKATMQTSVEGVFAAGDCTGKPYQIAKAVGDGNIAALSAAQYIGERSRANE